MWRDLKPPLLPRMNEVKWSLVNFLYINTYPFFAYKSNWFMPILYDVCIYHWIMKDWVHIHAVALEIQNQYLIKLHKLSSGNVLIIIPWWGPCLSGRQSYLQIITSDLCSKRLLMELLSVNEGSLIDTHQVSFLVTGHLQ